MRIPRERPLATLWQLTWNDDRVTCVVYQGAAGLQLRIESATDVIMSEPFVLRPRAFAQARALRESLKRRGWREAERNPS